MITKVTCKSAMAFVELCVYILLQNYQGCHCSAFCVSVVRLVSGWMVFFFVFMILLPDSLLYNYSNTVLKVTLCLVVVTYAFHCVFIVAGQDTAYAFVDYENDRDAEVRSHHFYCHSVQHKTFESFVITYYL